MLNNFIILATAILTLRANDVKEPVNQRESRIINGREAEPFSFPFVVSLKRNGIHGCGGTLLDSTTVLTAAHCTDDSVPNSELTANIRRHDLRLSSTEEGGQTIGISRRAIHPNYGEGYLNDIAIWKLDSPVSVPVAYVTLNDGTLASEVDLPAETIGWGRINPNNNVSVPWLQHTVPPIYDHEQCSKGYNDALSREAQVCAGYSEGISSACQGDSGGPLFVKKGDRVVQIGITSFGANVKCLNPGAPTVFARIANYRSFIQREQRRRA